MSGIILVPRNDRLVVEAGNSSMGVVNAGPKGPIGIPGPDHAAADTLTTNGDFLTLASGLLAPISRAALAADPSFASRYLDQALLASDGQLLTRAAGDPTPVTRASLASDTAFSPYVKRTKGTTTPAGTGNDGDEYLNTTTSRWYRSDGTGWIIISEPPNSWTPAWSQGVVISKASTQAKYMRSNGWCKGYFTLNSGNAGTAGQSILSSVPIAMNGLQGIIGFWQFFQSVFNDGPMYNNGGSTWGLQADGLTVASRTTPTIASFSIFTCVFDYEMTTRYS
jgi:hypothetical protein